MGSHLDNVKGGVSSPSVSALFPPNNYDETLEVFTPISVEPITEEVVSATSVTTGSIQESVE